MNAEEIIAMIRESVQIFSLEPLRDGYADDIIVRPSTRILPWVNRAYRDLVKKGIYQCWHQLILSPNRPNYRLSGNFTLVHDHYIADASDVTPNNTYDLDYVQDSRKEGEQYFRATTTGRPRQFAFSGNMMFFDTKPDVAYRVYLLADTVPAMLAARTDVPSVLDVQLHDALVAGGSYYIGRAALNRPQITPTNGHYMRFAEIKAEWEQWKKDVMETTESRVTNASVGPMTNRFTGYRTHLSRR